jgi:enoyl-CoA hydratase/carnithine racemase
MAELITRREGNIGWIIFSNPPKLNAVTYDMMSALPEAMARLDRDPQVKAIAFGGSGMRAFVSGADVKEFGATRGSAGATATYNNAMEEAYKSVSAARKPTLACIRGMCFGVGLSVALYCDMRVCSDDAEFGHQAAKLGMAISFPSIKRLVDIIGAGGATDMLFTGRRVPAAEALQMGLIHRVYPSAGLDSSFVALAAEIAEGAPLSHVATKMAIRSYLGDADMRDVKAAIEACHASEDYKEGPRAFAEKRKPNFRGR